MMSQTDDTVPFLFLLIDGLYFFSLGIVGVCLFPNSYSSFSFSFLQDTHSGRYHSGNKAGSIVSQLSGNMNQVKHKHPNICL